MDRTRARSILLLALPIIGGMLSQNIFNLVDTAMVGVLGPTALAGVGVGGYANFFFIAVVMGLASGVQAMSARRVGEKRESVAAAPLNGGLLMAIGVGILISAVAYSLAPHLFAVLNPDPEVRADGVPYLRARVLAATAVGMNFAFRGYWTGVNLSGIYLKTLVAMHIANILLNYLLIFGKFGFPEMGAEGAGWASMIANYLGTVIYFVFSFRLARANGFLHGLPDRATMATMVRLALPAAMQALLFSVGLIALFWILGRIGTAEVAVSNVLITLYLVAILPCAGFGLAGLSLVGQALGAGDFGEAKRWGWDVVRITSVVLIAIGAPAVLAPELILSGFLHESATLALGAGPLRLMGATIVIEAAATTLGNCLKGAGAAKASMAVSVSTQWLIGLPAAWFVGAYLGYGILGIWIAWIAYRALQAAIYAVLWSRGDWASIKV